MYGSPAASPKLEQKLHELVYQQSVSVEVEWKFVEWNAKKGKLALV